MTLKLRNILVALVAAISILPASAESVSQREALSRASTFFNAAYGQVMSQPKLVYTGKRLTTRSLFIPFYVYNHPAGGFVIISAENKAFPILGYSLTDTFDESKMGDKTRALLRSFARDIERIRYDSAIPYAAIEAWNDYPHFINTLLTSDYQATDPTIEAADAAEIIERIVDSDDPTLASVTYSTDQWEDAINEELAVNRSVALGIYENDAFLPTVVHGHRGDYYRITLDGPNAALYRLFATEVLSQGEIAQLGRPIVLPEEKERDMAFRFFEDFVKETRAEREAAQTAIENAGMITEPTVLRLGGGHFEIQMPEEIDLVRVYNIDGSLVRQNRFASTSTAWLDLSPEPAGLYLVTLEANSGRTYGVKLLR